MRTLDQINDELIEINGLLQMARHELEFNPNLALALKKLDLLMESNDWGTYITEDAPPQMGDY